MRAKRHHRRLTNGSDVAILLHLTSQAPRRPRHSFRFEGNGFLARLAEPVRAVINCVKCGSNVLNQMSLNVKLIHCHLTIQGRFDLVERVGQSLNLEIVDSGGGPSNSASFAFLESCLLVHDLGSHDFSFLRHVRPPWI